ncbi:MFS transporter [Enterococcus camelliae]|uniref:MFS transporter n=1 Tax=Enterococcus camelliae TaxID=453959 RepID=A0ABW5THR4_9ENTE
MEEVQRSEKIWSKNFIVTMLISTFATTAITMQMGSLPIYVTQLGGSKALSGFIVGILGLSALVTRFPVGVWLDKYGRKRLLLVGIFLLLLDFGLLTLYKTLLILFLLRMVQGIANSIQSTTTSTIAADCIPSEHLAEGLGYYSIAQALPSAIGPLIGLTIAEKLGFQRLFQFAFVLVLIAFFLSFLVQDQYVAEQKKTQTNIPNQEGDETLQAIFKRKSILIPSAILFFICFANSGVVSFLAQYAAEKHIGGAGYYFTVMSLVMVCVRFVLPNIFVYMKSFVLVVASIFLVGLAFFLIAWTTNFWGLIVAAVLYGVGYASLLPIMNTIVLENAASSERGKATAIFSASLDVAYGGGVLLWGVVASLTNFTTMYLLCAIFVIISLILVVIYKKALSM